MAMRRGATTLCCLALVLLVQSPAVADVEGDAAPAGIKTGLTRTELGRAKAGLDIKTGAPDTRSFEYKTLYACGFNTPGDTAALCANAVQACSGNTPEQGLGPL